MDLDQFLAAFEREHAVRPFGIMNNQAIRQVSTEYCPLVGVANGQHGGHFTSNIEFNEAAKHIGLSLDYAAAVVRASDVPYYTPKGIDKLILDRLLSVIS